MHYVRNQNIFGITMYIKDFFFWYIKDVVYVPNIYYFTDEHYEKVLAPLALSLSLLL